MKQFLLCLLLLVQQVQTHAQSKKRSALFIGNSYTYFNTLPQLVEQLAIANGDTLETDSYAPGGYTFNNHSSDPNCIAKIYSRNWDYVILQAQSQEPSFSPAQVNAQTLPYALKLDSLIKDNYACSKTVFFETWGRKNGDASNCAAYPPVCTYSGMQNRLKQSYLLFANLCSGILAPAGEAFRESILQNPNLELYQADQSHPSLEGSYLSAAVFYETLFQKSVVGNTFISTVPSGTATLLQNIAHKVVRDSLQVWKLGINQAWAEFTYTASSLSSYQFQSYSPSLNTLWYFGDGSFTTAASPFHTYTQSGNYTVSQVVSENCGKDSATTLLSVSLPLALAELETAFDVYFYPNPAQEKIVFNHPMLRSTVYSLTGQKLLEKEQAKELYLQTLDEGLYLLKMENNQQVVYRTLLVKR